MKGMSRCASYGYSNGENGRSGSIPEYFVQASKGKYSASYHFSDDEYIVKALRLGAKGYLLKQDYGSILPALRAVYCGQTVFGTEIVSRYSRSLQGEKKFDYGKYDINEREFEMIELIANGYSNKEIAAELFLSEGTVRNYLSMILEKLQLRDRTQVAVFYYQHK